MHAIKPPMTTGVEPELTLPDRRRTRIARTAAPTPRRRLDFLSVRVARALAVRGKSPTLRARSAHRTAAEAAARGGEEPSKGSSKTSTAEQDRSGKDRRYAP